MSPSKAGAGWDAERVTVGRHFLRDMEALWGEILKLAAVVEVSITTSVRALCDGRADLAAQVTGEERSIDSWEVRIERDCLRVLALHQPVASDLRRVAAVLKINSDLERMGDLAEHIADRVRKLAGKPQALPIPQEMETMATEVVAQVRDSLDALAKSDADAARAVIAGDRHDQPAPPRGPQGAQGGDPPRAGPGQHLAPPDQHRAEPRADRRPRDQHRRGGRLPERGEHHPPRRRPSRLRDGLIPRSPDRTAGRWARLEAMRDLLWTVVTLPFRLLAGAVGLLGRLASPGARVRADGRRRRPAGGRPVARARRPDVLRRPAADAPRPGMSG